MPEFSQGFGLDLANPLPGYREILPDFFKGVIRFFAYPESHPEDFFFPGGQRGQHLPTADPG